MTAKDHGCVWPLTLPSPLVPCEQSLFRSSSEMSREEEIRLCQPARLSLICRSSKELDESVQFRLVKPVFLICARDQSPRVINIFLNLQQRDNF